MKISKKFLPIILVLALGFGWVTFVMGTISTLSNYKNCLKEAENSIEAGLYEQAIEFYKDSLNHKKAKKIYVKIKETYDVFYEEEHTPYVRNIYLQDMIEASDEFPKSAMFWEQQINLYLETENYSKAYAAVNKAFNYGANSKTLKKMEKKLLYMTETDYKLYPAHKTALNGYISVLDRNGWVVMDESGDVITNVYKLAGLINDDGKGLYINDIDTRILDKDEITRARFDITVEDAGLYNESVDLMPVKVDGVWKYINSKGDFLPGEFEIAGSYSGGEAVAYTGKSWVLLDKKGKQKNLAQYEDIKLDLYGCHNQNGVILAKENGTYHIYDEDFKRKGNFEADNVDICINEDLIAFEKDGKWGFVQPNGKIVMAPKYSKAKSFANGYAAVCNEQHLWGFINDDFEEVIDFKFFDAFYFNENETCLVSNSENTVQLMKFMF